MGTAQVRTAGGGSRLLWSVIEVLHRSLLSLTDDCHRVERPVTVTAVGNWKGHRHR